jgi:hypothetical protein
MTRGLFPASWEKAKYPHDLLAAGNFKSARLRPLIWKPDYPNPALLKMMLQDAYWGAKRVMSFSQAIPPPGNLVVCRGLGQGGIQNFMEYLSGPMATWWQDLGNPTLGPELQQKIVAGVLQESAGRSIDELDHYRDEVLLGLLSLRAKADSSTVS